MTDTAPSEYIAREDADTDGPTAGGQIGTTPRNLRRSLVSAVLGSILGFPLALVSVPLILSRLDLTTFGVFATLGSFLATIGLIEVGVSTEVIRRVAAAHGAGDREAMRRSVHEGLTILSALAAAGLALAAVFAFGFPSLLYGNLPPDLAGQAPWVTFAVAVSFAVDLALSGWFATLAGLQRTDAANYGALVGGVVGTSTSIGLVFAGAGLWALAIGGAVQVVLSLSWRALVMRRIAPDIDPRFTRVSMTATKAYASTSSVVLVASLANVIDFQFDRILLANFLGAAAAGAYSIGASLVLQARSLSLLPMGLLVPSTSELREGDRLALVRRTLTQLNTAAALLLMGGVMIYAEPFIHLWLGGQYGGSVRAAEFLSIALLLNALTGPWYNHCLALGTFRLPLSTSAANAAVNAAVSWILIDLIGFDGALIGSIAGNAISFCIFLIGMPRAHPSVEVLTFVRPLIILLPLGAVFGVVSSCLPSTWPLLVAQGTLWLTAGVVVLAALGELDVVRERVGCLVRSRRS